MNCVLANLWLDELSYAIEEFSRTRESLSPFNANEIAATSIRKIAGTARLGDVEANSLADVVDSIGARSIT